MKPSKLRIKNYRNIGSEINISFKEGLTIVGPNNSGKTNILRAIQLFFSGPGSRLYSPSVDLPFKRSGEQTSITVYFEVDGEDDEFFPKYRAMLNSLEVQKDFPEEIPLFLYFTSTGTAVYKFFANEKIKSKEQSTFQKAQAEALKYVLHRFSCKYIPSEKNAGEFYASFLSPMITESVGSILQTQILDIQKELDGISTGINENLAKNGLPNVRSGFSIPDNLIQRILSKFEFNIDDGDQTKAETKGSGIQSVTLFGALEWISQKEKLNGKNVIWLIEEPESYLHPSLARSCKSILTDLAKNHLLLVTTHSISFVDQDPSRVVETSVEAGETVVKKFTTYTEATASIRSALGLRFSDFYNLSNLNIFVEGKTDREIMQWALGIIKAKAKANKFEKVRDASILDFSGISRLEDFLKASYQFMRGERAIAVLFDGDEAGVKSSRALMNYMANKEIPFRANEEFVLLSNGMPIEGLFPHQWIIDLYSEFPKWFPVLLTDMSGKLISFKIDDDSKKSVQARLMKRAEEETIAKAHYAWAASFIALFGLLEKMLETREKAVL